MSGDNLSFDNFQGYVQAGKHIEDPDFGVDLAQPQMITWMQGQEIRPQPHLQFSGENVFQVAENASFDASGVKNDGPFGAISIPPGWSEMIPPGQKPGTNVFRLQDGQSFVPPDHYENPSVKIHIGPGLESVPPQTEAALRRVLESKPAMGGQEFLTREEFKSVSGIIRPFDGGNNQFHDMGALVPKFDVTSASTVNVNGKTALLVKGEFLQGAQAGQMRESLYIENQATGGIEQIYLTAPKDKIQRYENSLWDTVRSSSHIRA